MATHVIQCALTLPDTSGNVYFEPASVNFGSNDRYPGMVLVFKDTATRIGCGFQFRVPKNYIGSGTFLFVWGTTATAGNLDLEIDYTSVADGETMDPAADQENLATTQAAPGTARLQEVASIAATAANFAADDVVIGTVFRDGADADTIAASVYCFGLFFQYADI